jgi:hypothetical protein
MVPPIIVAPLISPRSMDASMDDCQGTIPRRLQAYIDVWIRIHDRLLSNLVDILVLHQL